MSTSTLDSIHLGHRPAAFVPEPKSHKNASSERRSAFAAIAALFRRLVDAVVRANQRQVLHRQLIALDDRLLADIGINCTDIPRLVADSYRTYTKAPEVQSAEARHDPRHDPLTIEEDPAVMDVPANDIETPRAA